MSTKTTDILIYGKGGPLVVRPYRCVLVVDTRNVLVEQRSPSTVVDADLFAVCEQSGRELGVVIRSGRKLVARISGRFGVDEVRSITAGARFCANNQPPSRPSWM